MNISGWETQPEFPVASLLLSAVRVSTPPRGAVVIWCVEGEIGMKAEK